MSKSKNKKNQQNAYTLKRKDYLKGWLFALPRRRRMTKAIAEGLTITPESKKNIALKTELNAEKYSKKTAILYEDISYTHKEYNEWCNRYANFFLNKVGLKKGDVAIVYLINRPEILFIIVGLAKIGVISSLINTKQREKPLIHSITHAPGKVFIIGEELIDAFSDVKSKLNLTEEQFKHLYFLPDKGEAELSQGFKNLYDLVKDEDINNPQTSHQIEAKDPYAYIFTSGTTGLPKAAIITHGHTVGSSIYWGDTVVGMKQKDIMYITTPLFHSNAINVAYAAALRYGSAMAISRKFSVSKFWDDAIKFKATCFNYIGEICRYLYNKPPKPTDRKHDVVKIVGNGLRNEMWKGFKKRFGIRKIFEFYGATERFSPNFANRFNLDCTIGFCGSPYAIVKYDINEDEPIKDEDGFMIKVEKGEAGLLLGQVDPNLFYNYTDKKADEKKIFRNVFVEGDTYMNTGDLLREIGYSHAQFVDRLGDTFRWKGENVSTEEVESVVNLFEQVDVCSVYGVQIPNTEGRAGMVSIVANSHSGKDFNFNGFLQHVQKYLPEYALPKFIRFKKSLDTTATLKIQKGDLKKQGFDINKVKDSIYVLLPGVSNYTQLTNENYEKILNAGYNF
ncbi:MAG: Long-chain-fatty-acid--CoA ligase FadD17 [Candidatus Lokiarchaeum sp. GC14_75]|nr:MAG: Long-chain-fatty-acid--CoA ligase FadD17 [Candidatus Lokiarchaeum sp. GC14_75]